tara:strand:+ start:794 stop:1105 length:312 start_codon:yes stop_codon:yes gene_type:complete
METLTLQEKYDRLNEKFEMLLEAMSEQQIETFDEIKKNNKLKEELKKANEHINEREQSILYWSNRAKDMQHDLETERKRTVSWKAITDKRLKTMDEAIELLNK